MRSPSAFNRLDVRGALSSSSSRRAVEQLPGVIDKVTCLDHPNKLLVLAVDAGLARRCVRGTWNFRFDRACGKKCVGAGWPQSVSRPPLTARRSKKIKSGSHRTGVGCSIPNSLKLFPACRSSTRNAASSMKDLPRRGSYLIANSNYRGECLQAQRLSAASQWNLHNRDAGCVPFISVSALRWLPIMM